MKLRLSVALALICLVLQPVVALAASDVMIENASDWSIHQLYLSAVDEDDWGPDQLGEDVINPGEKFVLKKIPCDTYDIKLIDEDEDECVVQAVDVCGDDHWVITSEDLASCQGYE